MLLIFVWCWDSRLTLGPTLTSPRFRWMLSLGSAPVTTLIAAGRQQQSVLLWDCHMPKPFLVVSAVFLTCFSRDVKRTCTFAIGPGNKAIILQTRHFTRIKPHVSSYISMTVLRLLCSSGLCDNYFSKLDAAFLPWGVATCGQSGSQLMSLRMKKLTWCFEEKVESGVFKLKETQGIISSQL